MQAITRVPLSLYLGPNQIDESAVAGRTFSAGERGSAAGSLLSSHCPNYTWACVLCRPSPELPFHFVWFLGWSTWHLALDPSSVLYLQHKLCSYFDALQHLPRSPKSPGMHPSMPVCPCRWWCTSARASMPLVACLCHSVSLGVTVCPLVSLDELIR